MKRQKEDTPYKEKERLAGDVSRVFLL